MISSAFHTAIYVPLYNGLVFLVDVVPWHDMGIAVIALTVLVRFLIYPLSRRAIRSQMAMKELAPKVEELNKKFKKNSPEHSKAVWDLYKEKGIHPFSSLGLILIQLPVLFGLYWVFLKGGFPAIDTSLLYSFVHPPTDVNMMFLGLVDMGKSHNIVLAILVGITQAVYSRLSMGPRAAAKAANVEASLSEDMARSFDLQARYMLPVIFAVASYFIVAAAPLYWATGNLFMIAQEYVTGRRF
jgi:YidC/Oxa1 family membrane protein insertase